MRGQLPVGLRRAEGPGVVDQPQAVRVGLPDPALPGDHGLPPDQAAVLVLLPGQGEGVAGVQHLYKQQGQRSRHQKQKKKASPPIVTYYYYYCTGGRCRIFLLSAPHRCSGTPEEVSWAE